MTPAFISDLGLGAATSLVPPMALDDDNSATRALPATWYTSQDMYELERRAIFSRKWLLTTHKTRLAGVGDWLRYEVAGFQFILARDREGNINAFHNICRHRAYPVVTEDKGTARIFSCRYHGWSYGLNGKLAKAPGYQELEGFDKSKNSLLPIHSHIDRNGFVWVNFDGKEAPDIAWDDDFEGVDTQQRLQDFDFDDYEFDHQVETEGSWNWKILADSYNESYRCAAKQADNPSEADLKPYSVKTQAGWIQHDATPTAEQQEKGLNFRSTYVFPNASMNVSPHLLYLQRFVPQGSKSSIMRCEVYRNKNSSEENFELVSSTLKRALSEDKTIYNLSQKNINTGVFINGELHPQLEKGVLFFQQSVRDCVMSHHELEQAAKEQIWPARQRLPTSGTGLISKKDVDFCSGLACAPANQEQLAW